MIRPSIKIAMALLILALAGVGFWAGVTGYLDGEVAAGNRFNPYTVKKYEDPTWFWIYIAMWIALGITFLLFGLYTLRQANIERRKRRAWR